MADHRIDPAGLRGDPSNDNYVLSTLDGKAFWAPPGALPTGGTAGQVLTKQSGTDGDADWADPTGGGLTDPTTTLGDLIVNDGSGVDRLGVGTDGQVLTADSGEALGVAWADAPSGGGAATYLLDPASLHATYGDHFTGASLAAKWNRQGYTSAGESFQQGGGSWFQQDTSKTTNSYYWQTAPSGDFTVVMSAIHYASSDMFGPLILDSSGNGVASVAATGEGYYIRSVTAGSQVSGVGSTALTSAYVLSGARTWFKLNKTGTAYKASLSTNGVIWRPWTSTVTFATTPTRIGFGNVFGTCIGFAVDWFDVQ